MASLIDGRAVAARLRETLAKEVAGFTGVRTPKLVAVIVGDRPDSATYVRMKTKACAEVGIASEVLRLAHDVSQADLMSRVDSLSSDERVHGILVQLPLPPHIDERAVLERIDTSKDVDGFHAKHLGLLAMGHTDAIPVSCTPKGIMHLLDAYGVELAGKEVVVVGRSSIVGLPVSLLCMRRSATVTMCHSKTVDLQSHLKRADVVIAACGKPRFIKGEWLKEGAVIIDVGINSIDAPDTRRGYRLVGDVDFDEAVKVASMITPVPGGVGPMTVACLLENLVEGYKRQIKD